ncbi:hypothetical protein RC52_05890 [Herbaspirillum rubrisubalbicans]|nr:hypothetical protein [Herbaspirillum rubrisubalbicans]
MQPLVPWETIGLNTVLYDLPPAETGNSLDAAGLISAVTDERADAERYRWLKSQRGQEHDSLLTVQHELDGVVWGSDLDAAIDAARAALQPAEEGGGQP